MWWLLFSSAAGVAGGTPNIYLPRSNSTFLQVGSWASACALPRCCCGLWCHTDRQQHLVHRTLESDGGSKQAECDRSVKRRSIWTLNFHCSTFVICNLSESYSSLEKLYEQPKPFKKLFLYSAALVAALLKNGKVLLLKQVLTNYFPKSDISKAWCHNTLIKVWAKVLIFAHRCLRLISRNVRNLKKKNLQLNFIKSKKTKG